MSADGGQPARQMVLELAARQRVARGAAADRRRPPRASRDQRRCLRRKCSASIRLPSAVASPATVMLLCILDRPLCSARSAGRTAACRLTAASRAATPDARAAFRAAAGLPLARSMRRDRARSASKIRDLLGANSRVVDVEVGLVVEAERAVVEIGRADRDQQLVDDHHLAVVHRRLVLVDLGAGPSSSPQLRARRARARFRCRCAGPGMMMRTLDAALDAPRPARAASSSSGTK